MIPTKVDSLWWNASFLQGLELTPLAIARVALIFVVAYLLSVLLRRALSLTAMRQEIDPGVRYSLGRVLSLVILLVAALMALRTIGIDIGSLAVIGGALGSASASGSRASPPTSSPGWCCCSSGRSGWATASPSARSTATP